MEVKPHSRLNVVKGTIYYQNRPNYSNAQLIEAMQEYKVTDIHQLTKYRNGTPSPVYIVSFNSPIPPSEVSIGWNMCSVREYVPRPRRCLKCQKFGHIARTCRSLDEICNNCGCNAHEEQCDQPPRCSNCGRQHKSSDQNCFYYKLEQETLTIQTKERVSYGQAKRVARSNLGNNSDSTYASVVRQQAHTVQKRNMSTQTDTNDDQLRNNHKNEQSGRCLTARELPKQSHAPSNQKISTSRQQHTQSGVVPKNTVPKTKTVNTSAAITSNLPISPGDKDVSTSLPPPSIVSTTVTPNQSSPAQIIRSTSKATRKDEKLKDPKPTLTTINISTQQSTKKRRHTSLDRDSSSASSAKRSADEPNKITSLRSSKRVEFKDYPPPSNLLTYLPRQVSTQSIPVISAGRFGSLNDLATDQSK